MGVDIGLGDVGATERGDRDMSVTNLLSASRWLTRGWTLQELIAPRKLDFFSQAWIKLGDKRSLQRHLTDITALMEEFFPVRQAHSLAASRRGCLGPLTGKQPGLRTLLTVLWVSST